MANILDSIILKKKRKPWNFIFFELLLQNYWEMNDFVA